MDRLQAMTAFVAVVDQGSFAAASRRLAVSPAMVTRAVADLERRLGLALLVRTTRWVRTTDAGAAYADDCRRVLAEIEEAETSATGARRTPRGTLALTAPVLFGHLHLMPIVVEYLGRHPEVDAQCLFVDRVVNLVEEGIDVALRIGELPDSQLHAVRVGRVRRLLVAAPAYLERHGTPSEPAGLQQHTLISASGIAPGADWRFSHQGRTSTLRLQPRLRCTSNDAARAAAVAGFGITRLLSYQVAGELQRGELRVLLEEHETAPVPVHLLHPEGRRATQKVRAFVDLAVQRLQADAALR